MPDALQDVTVIEFGAYAAGPAIGKYLANFGARVIHVESVSRPDGFRLQYPPYKDNKVGINRSGCFAFFNDSKFGVTLNLKEPAGLEIAERMASRADVVIENLRPGVMDRLGLGYERLREINPAVVMLSTCNLGQTGPYATQPGFGSQLSSLSGFTHLIGEPEGPPNFLYGPYIDFVAVVCGGAAVLAALDRKRRTGEGAFIDLSQYEAGLQFIGGGLLDYAANGSVAMRAGNRDPEAVPHGCFATRDGNWIVISCWSDEEWRRLCVALDAKDWLTDRFATSEGRRRHDAVIRQGIAARVAGEEAREFVSRLQRADVHAAVVSSVADLFSDPQLASRGAWQAREHSEIGQHSYRLPAYQLSETPGTVRGPAPCLGEHNRQVFREWLGMTEAEFAEADKAAAFS